MTLSRIPGDHSVPSSLSFSGLTSHCSPGSNWVKPRISFSPGASMMPFMVVSISVPLPTFNERVASTSWLINRSDLPTEPTRITREAAEHF